MGNGGFQGINDFGHLGFSGPCPPKGETHTYFTHVYALDTELALPVQSQREALLAAMEGHIVGHGVMTAPYTRDVRSDEGVVFNTPTP
jgi:Raf kinase inhibitor-like YbhB/YbcL family protein